MKSFSDKYSETHHNTHETFADLIFCAFIVLLLFVLTLVIEVSQRVRASSLPAPQTEPIAVVENASKLSPEEIEELSMKLQSQQNEMNAQRVRMAKQQDEIERLTEQVREQESVVQNQVAALQGEQRFTGATEPAKVLLAYDYKKQLYVFVRQKEFDHAVTEQSGENSFEYRIRSTRELVQLALKCRDQRFYSEREMKQIYAAFTEYMQINPLEVGYDISSENVSVSYGLILSAYIAGDTELSEYKSLDIENAMSELLEVDLQPSANMYPSATVRVNETNRSVTINGIELSANDFKDMLLAIGGRGLMLDFTGYNGKAPQWLVEDVLTPTGYIGKTPKLPDQR